MKVEDGSFITVFEGTEIRVKRIDIESILQRLLEKKVATGIYVCIRPDTVTSEKISKFFEDSGIPDLIAPSEYHATVMYAPDQDINDFDISDEAGDVTGTFGGFALYGEDKDCLVMKIDSEALHELHEKIAAMGIQHSYSDYSPHLTLSYKAGGVDLTKLKKPDFGFHFKDELEINAIDKDYKKKVATA